MIILTFTIANKTVVKKAKNLENALSTIRKTKGELKECKSNILLTEVFSCANIRT